MENNSNSFFEKLKKGMNIKKMPETETEEMLDQKMLSETEIAKVQFASEEKPIEKKSLVVQEEKKKIVLLHI